MEDDRDVMKEMDFTCLDGYCVKVLRSKTLIVATLIQFKYGFQNRNVDMKRLYTNFFEAQ